MSERALAALAWTREMIRDRFGTRLGFRRARASDDNALANDARVAHIIENLPHASPLQTVEAVNHWLGKLNTAAGFSVPRRFQLAGMFEAAARRARLQLLDSHVAGRDPGGEAEKRAWQALTEFWTLLGAVYLECARQCGERDLPRALQAQLPALAARGLHALRHQLKCVLFRYGAVRTELWAECGVLVALAESVGGAGKRVELHEGSGVETTLNDELLRLVMFWTLAPNGLSPLEQDIADRVVGSLVSSFKLSTFHEDAFDYFFDLAGTRPPLRLVRSSPWTPQTRYFEAGEARRTVQTMHALASGSGRLPPGTDFGAAAEPGVLARVLAHISLNWAREMPARAAERRKAEMAMTVVQGYEAVQRVLLPADAEGSQPQDFYLQELWVTYDVSAGGYGLTVPAVAGEWLQVGDLIALRASPDVPWHLGIIRRVQADTDKRRRIGMELVSKAAAAVQVRSLSGIARGGKAAWAIMLDEWPLADGSVEILVRRDQLSGREAVEVTYGADRANVILAPGGLVESGQDFDWLRYRLPAGLPTQ
jgi:hypothetical protein